MAIGRVEVAAFVAEEGNGGLLPIVDGSLGGGSSAATMRVGRRAAQEARL